MPVLAIWNGCPDLHTDERVRSLDRLWHEAVLFARPFRRIAVGRDLLRSFGTLNRLAHHFAADTGHTDFASM